MSFSFLRPRTGKPLDLKRRGAPDAALLRNRLPEHAPDCVALVYAPVSAGGLIRADIDKVTGGEELCAGVEAERIGHGLPEKEKDLISDFPF